MPAENRYQLYLISKEASNNTVKYSKGNLLELIVKESNQLLQITISDTGEGFKPVSIKSGNGLNNMQQRADELGAGFTVQASQGKGCIISLKVKIT